MGVGATEAESRDGNGPRRLWPPRPRNRFGWYGEAALFNLEAGWSLAEAMLRWNHFPVQPENGLNDRHHSRRPTCMSDQRLIRSYTNRTSRADHLPPGSEFGEVPGWCSSGMSNDPIDILNFNTWPG